MNARKAVFRSAVLGSMMLSATAVYADQDEGPGACGLLPSHAVLKAALIAARAAANGGFNLDMWGTVVNRDGGGWFLEGYDLQALPLETHGWPQVHGMSGQRRANP